MDVLGQSALILAVTAFSLAITALTRNLRNKLVLNFAGLCAVISGWAFAFFLEKIIGTGTFYTVHMTFNLALAPVGLQFVSSLTRVNSRFMRVLYAISLIYTAVVLVLQWIGLAETSLLVRSLATYAPTFLVVATVYLMLRDWRVRRGQITRAKISTVGLSRRNWVYAGALFVLMMAAMDHVPQFGEVLPSIGNVLVCIYLFLVSEAIIHQRLLNLSALLNRVLVLVFITLIMTLVYSTLVAWIDNEPGLFVLNTFLASFIILMMIEPITKLTQMGVVRVFSRRFLRYQKKLQEAEAQLVGALDTTGLAQLTLNFVESVLRCESATVFTLRSDGAKFRRIRGLRDDGLGTRELLATHPIVGFFAQMRRLGEVPVILDLYLINEIDRSTSQLRRQDYDLILKAMQGLNANIAIPFLDGATVLGFVVLKVNNPPEPWGNSWGILQVIYPFFQQAARTLKNMDVYVRLREKDRLAALGEMAAGLAHEIRNPLGAIKGAAQFLDAHHGEARELVSAAEPVQQQAFLQVIVEEVNRLNRVVTQFLDYSKPVLPSGAPQEIGAILEKTVALFQSSYSSIMGKTQNSGAGTAAPDKGSLPRIELVTPPEGFGALPRVSCNPEQIKQVLVNLIQNAVQSLTEQPPAGGGLIQIGATTQRRRRDAALEVVLFVEDNGKGIPRDNLDKIFIPFFTTSPGGTGLGLPICSQIIAAHGGRIDVTSEEGKATRFMIHLPVSPESPEETE